MIYAIITLVTQREIAAEITNKLQLKLSGEGEERLAKKYTINDQAYQLYLKGRFHFAKRVKDDILTSIDYFQQAIKLDPNFALAYVGISDSYNALPLYSYLSPKEANPLATAAATRALEIDPMLAEAHTALASSITINNWNWQKAEQGFKRAIELSPNVAETHYRYALSFLLQVGRSDEAIAEIGRAMELEPLELSMGASLAAAYMYARQNDRALEQARKTFDLAPNLLNARAWLGIIYNANGMYEEAIALSEKSLQSNPNSQIFLYVAGYAYARAGRRNEAEGIIKRWREIGKTQYVSHYSIASILTALGESDKAFAELEKAFEQNDQYLSRLRVDPLIDPLRDDPRYKEMLKRLNLPE